MATIKPPVSLLEEGQWQLLFGSLDDLLSYVEAIDVRDGIYTVLDRDGRIVELEAESDDGAVTARVTDRIDPGRLENALRKVIARQPVRWGLLDADVGLDVLLRAMWARTRSDAFPT